MNRRNHILKVAEVAELLRVHPSTIYRLIKIGEFPGFKIGQTWRIDAENLDTWLMERGKLGPKWFGQGKRN